MKTLTAQQERVLSVIQESVATRGYPPSVREIGDMLGLSSSSTVHSHMRALENKGFIEIDPEKPRAVTVLDRTGVVTKATIKYESVPDWWFFESEDGTSVGPFDDASQLLTALGDVL